MSGDEFLGHGVMKFTPNVKCRNIYRYKKISFDFGLFKIYIYTVSFIGDFL